MVSDAPSRCACPLFKLTDDGGAIFKLARAFLTRGLLVALASTEQPRNKITPGATPDPECSAWHSQFLSPSQLSTVTGKLITVERP